MRTTDKHVFFWNGIYSNWHPYYFYDPVAKKGFDNSEQAFMWYKADFFRDYTTRDLIGENNLPHEVKRLGRQIANYNDAAWDCVRLGYMVWVNYCKFSYVPAINANSIGAALLATEDRTLVEASPLDKVWGVGLEENNPLIENENNWQGQNLLGYSLMVVRNKIKLLQ